MRDDVDVLGDDDLRLVDVLLEEQFAAAAHAPRRQCPAPLGLAERRSPVWAAAAALFALAVLLGTWWLRRDAVAPAQDPAPTPRATTAFEPKDDAELQAFLPQVVEIEACSAVWYGRSDLDVLRPGGAKVRLASPDVVRAMCSGWTPRGATADHASHAVVAQLTLTTRDGRRLQCTIGGVAGNTCYVGAQCWRASGIDGPTLQRMSEEETVADASALRGMPSTRANLDCTALGSADLQAELRRFASLARLVVTLDDRMAAVVAACPTLEDLAVVIPPGAAGLGRAGWTQIASLPRLHRLRLTGDVGAITPEHLSLLQRLQELDIPGDIDRKNLCSVGLLLAAARLPRLAELRIALRVPQPASPALPAEVGLSDGSQALAAMPALRRLALDADAPPLPLLHVLEDSHVARLHLAGFVLDAACMDALVAAKRLRELDLRGAQFTDQGRGLLPALRQLTRLDLRGAILTPAQLTALEEQLPKTDVLGSPGTTRRTFPQLANPSSWTEDR